MTETARVTKPKLSIELVPQTCWYSNVRTNVSSGDWEVCKRFVRDRSGDRCEICGGRGRQWPVECHEVWEYDDEARVQRLLDLIALCPACHEVKHIGRAEAVGNLPRALDHLMTVNGWDVDLTELYVFTAFDIWRSRSEHQWTLDISFLSEVLEP